jgi:hypothetical protein
MTVTVVSVTAQIVPHCWSSVTGPFAVAMVI